MIINSIMSKYKAVWTDIHESSLKSLFAHVKTIHADKILSYDNFVDIYKKELMSIIEKNMNWANGTKERLCFTIARWFLMRKKERYYKLYAQRGYEYMQSNKQKEGEGEQTEHEKLNYRDMDYCKARLKDLELKQYANVHDHYKFLAVAMLCLHPPVRTSFYTTSKFIFTKAENNKTDNFIRLDRRGKPHAYYIINADKVSHTKYYSMHPEMTTIEVNDELSNILNASYKTYPRTFLFESYQNDFKGHAITDATFLKILKNSLLSDINVNMLRSAFINDFYSKNQTVNKRDELARKMRHSQTTALLNYNKVSVVNNNSDIDMLKKENSELKLEIEKLKQALNLNSESDQFKLRRRDVLFKCNKKGCTPKESTLLKYNIKYENGIYT